MSWKPEDKDWLKARKAYWKVVKPMLSHTRLYDSKDIKLIKEYYLYGPEKEPLIQQQIGGATHKVSAAALLVAWLCPSIDGDEVLTEIKRFDQRTVIDGDERWYREGHNKFVDYTLAIGAEKVGYLTEYKLLGDSLFDGREELMCRLLLPKVIEHDERFKRYQESKYQQGIDEELMYQLGCLRKTIDTPDLMKNYLPQYRVPYIVSCCKYGIIEERALRLVERLFYVLEKIKAQAELYQSVQIQVASEFESGLVSNEADIPASTFEIFDKYRKLAKVTLLAEGIQPVD